MPKKGRKAVQTAPAAETKTTLPPKDAANFRAGLRQFEAKEYKRALKTIEAILGKYPQNGESLAMKGIIVRNLDGEESARAYALVEEGVKCNLKSFLCWHVYAIMCRMDNKWAKAASCYQMSAKLDPDNAQVVRDLGLVQLQARDLPGFLETTGKQLLAKSGVRLHWLTTAVAQHMNKMYSEALETIDSYLAAVDKVGNTEPPYELSEIMMYRVRILVDSGNVVGALEALAEHEDKITDKLTASELKANLLTRSGKADEAVPIFDALLEDNPENRTVHEGLWRALGATDEQVAQPSTLPQSVKDDLVMRYDILAGAHPDAATPVRLPLELLPADAPDYGSRVIGFLRPFLERGIPSAFSAIRSLYTSQAIGETIGKAIQGALASVEADGKFPGDAQPIANAGKVVVWLLNLQARHHDRTYAYKAALASIDRAIELGGEDKVTRIDLLLTKSTVLKHAGCHQAAADASEEARNLDLADRYLNTKSVARLLRANRIDEAAKHILAFADDNQPNNPVDMEATWYELLLGQAFERTGEKGKALRQYLHVEDHFRRHQDDLFDFHSYSIRRTTLRTYIDLLDVVNNLFSHKRFVAAAQRKVALFVDLHDRPPLTQEEKDLQAVAHLPESEQKKTIKKMKKQRLRDEEAAAAAAAKQPVPKTKLMGRQRPIKDPNGEEMLAVEDSLGMAAESIKPLLEYANDSPATQALAARIYVRKGKLLAALRAIKAGLALAPANADVHLARCELAVAATADAVAKMPEVVADVFRSEGKDIVLDGIDAVNAAYLAKCRSSGGFFAAARGLAFAGQKDAALQTLVDGLAREDVCGVYDGLEVAIAWAKTNGASDAQTASLVASARRRYPLAEAWQE